MKEKLFIILALLLTAVSGTWAQTSGNCGDGVTWSYDEGTLTISGSGAMADYDDKKDQPWKNNRSSITSVVIEKGVTHIGDRAFRSCDNLATVTFATGSQLTSIGKYAFYSSGLTSITIPASVTSIAKCAFRDCHNLATVTFATGSQLASIGELAFNNTNLTSVTIPASVTSIGASAFWKCTNLTSVTVYAPPTPTLGDGVFTDCASGLQIYVFSDYVNDYKAATNWNAYAGIITAIPSVGGNCGPEGHASDVTWELAFTSTSQTLTISGSDAMADYGFNQPWKDYLSTITSVVIEDGVTRIGASAFLYCTGLTSVTIPASVESIGVGTFEGCTGITSVTIPASVTNIGSSAFEGCSNLATVIVYASRPPTLSYDAFDDCANDLKIYVPSYYVYDYKSDWSAYGVKIKGFNGSCGATGHELNVIWALTGNEPYYTLTISGSGAMANYGGQYDQPWDDFRSSITSVVIEDGVTSIGENAFRFCEMTSVTTIGSGVKNIAIYAFRDCLNLATVNFATGSRLETIGNSAFYNSGLTSLEIPTKVTTIGQYAFSSCTGLTSITLPASVTSINYWAFEGCSNLESVTLNSNPYIGMGAFDDIKDGATVTMNLTANSADGAYWLTFYNDEYSFEADANTQVFKAALSDKSLTLTELTTDKIVKNNNAVILKSTASPIVMTLTSTGGSNDFTGNQLAGVYDPAGKTSDGTMYVLNNGTNGVGFYKLHAGSTLGVGKAYLTYSGTTAPSFFGFEDGTEIPGATDINNHELNELSGTWYSLDGRKLQGMPTQKGVYIVNGNKVVIK